MNTHLEGKVIGQDELHEVSGGGWGKAFTGGVLGMFAAFTVNSGELVDIRQLNGNKILGGGPHVTGTK
jgi:hypothetical protein